MKRWPLLLLFFCFLTGGNLFADVVMLKADFSEISGTITGTARDISIQTSNGVRSIPIDQVLSIRFGLASVPALPASPVSQSIVLPFGTNAQLPVGTAITVRTIDTIDSKTGDTTRTYAASLDEPLVVDGVAVVPAKVSAVLQIIEIDQAGRLKGNTTLSLRIVALTINGKKVGLETSDVVSASSGKGKSTMRDGAIGGAAGCGIGAAAAGAVGCGVGGAVGTVSGVATSVFIGKTVKIPPETRLTFKLSQAVWVPVPEPAMADTLSAGSEPLAAALKRGEMHTSAKEFDEALKEYRAAAAINGRSSLAHYSIGQVLNWQGNSPSAVDEFNEALKGDLDPKWVVVWAHVRLGQIFDQTGQRDRARNEYVQAVRTGDNNHAAQAFATGNLREPCREKVCPDVLTMSDGTYAVGNWLGMNGDKIRFLTEDRPQTYSKSDALAMTFGAVEVSATRAVPVAPPSAGVQAPPVVYGPEPEWVGAVFFRDEFGKFIPLERVTATYLPVGAGIGYSPLRLYRDFYVPTRRRRFASQTHNCRSRSRPPSCTPSPRSSVRTCRSSWRTARSSEPATAASSSRSTCPRTSSCCSFLPHGAVKRFDADVYAQFDGRGGEVGWQERVDALRSGLRAVRRPRDLARCPTTSPLRRAPSALLHPRRLSRRRQRRRPRPLRALPRADHGGPARRAARRRLGRVWTPRVVRLIVGWSGGDRTRLAAPAVGFGRVCESPALHGLGVEGGRSCRPRPAGGRRWRWRRSRSPSYSFTVAARQSTRSAR